VYLSSIIFIVDVGQHRILLKIMLTFIDDHFSVKPSVSPVVISCLIFYCLFFIVIMS